MKTRTVIIRRCETYDASIIEEIIKDGIEELKENPSGKILIKPNVVCSTPVVQSAHTHTSVVEATVNALRRMKAGDKTSRIEAPYSVNWDVQKVKTPIKFYPGINPESGRECPGGCLNALAGALATSELYYPGLIAGLNGMGIVIGYYRGDVVHPGEKVALIGSCAGVEGKLEAGKIIRIKGCPVKGMDQAAFLFPRLGIKTPAWKLSNVFGMVYHSIVKGLMLMARPFRKRIGEPGVPTLRRA